MLLRAAFWLPVASLLLRLMGFRQARVFFERRGIHLVRTSITTADIERAKATARMIRVAANNSVFRALCLQRSLVLTKFLGAVNIPCTMVLGARQQDEVLGAHAWVECGGVVVNDRPDIEQRYVPFRTPTDRLT